MRNPILSLQYAYYFKLQLNLFNIKFSTFQSSSTEEENIPTFIYFPTRPTVSSEPQNNVSTEPDVPITYWPLKGSGAPTNDGAQAEQPKPTERTQPGGRCNTTGLYSWVVALFYEEVYLTGGSLISPKVILTAAHNTMNKMNEDRIVVRAGEFVMNTTNEPIQYEERVVERIVRHEGFIFQSGINNVALIFVKTPFVLNDHIGVLTLPSRQASFEGRRCTVAGWDLASSHDQSRMRIIKKLELTVLDRTTCVAQFRNTTLGRNFDLHPSLICARSEINRDFCFGGGGYALFCSLGDENPHVFEQAGIVAWGMGCGLDLPGIYTNVAMFRSWIYNRIAYFG